MYRSRFDWIGQLQREIRGTLPASKKGESNRAAPRLFLSLMGAIPRTGGSALKLRDSHASIDPLPRHLAEVAFAVHYFLKNLDLIPDKTPVIGLVDDFAILKRVFARNRIEIENVIRNFRSVAKH
jgi:Protein of unknown function (DUF1232)